MAPSVRPGICIPRFLPVPLSIELLPRLLQKLVLLLQAKAPSTCLPWELKLEKSFLVYSAGTGANVLVRQKGDNLVLPALRTDLLKVLFPRCQSQQHTHGASAASLLYTSLDHPVQQFEGIIGSPTLCQFLPGAHGLKTSEINTLQIISFEIEVGDVQSHL